MFSSWRGSMDGSSSTTSFTAASRSTTEAAASQSTSAPHSSEIHDQSPLRPRIASHPPHRAGSLRRHRRRRDCARRRQLDVVKRRAEWLVSSLPTDLDVPLRVERTARSWAISLANELERRETGWELAAEGL